MALKFVLAVIASGLIFVIAPLIVRGSFCPPEDPASWHIQGYKRSGQNKAEPHASYYIAKTKKEGTGESQSNPEQSGQWFAPSWLCEEAKVTDLLIVFLTSVLAILGWFQLRSADENTKRAERAYIVAGSMYGVPKEVSGKWEMENRPKGALFKGPWRLAIFNFGRTAGYLTRLTWGVCPRDKFDKNTWVSKQIRDGSLATHIKQRVELQYIFDPTGNNGYHFRYVELEDRPVGSVLFGMIEYKDVFREPHYSTFAYEITAEYANGIGTSISDDHD